MGCFYGCYALKTDLSDVSATKEIIHNRYRHPCSNWIRNRQKCFIVRTADALIAVGGAYSTLSEIAFALQIGKPVVGIKTWDIKDVISVENAVEAVNKVFELLNS
jgi:hypothetical protein